LRHHLPDKIVYEEFNDYIIKRRKALEFYPSTAKAAMLITLNEFSLTNKTALIRKVGARFNIKLEEIEKNSTPYSQKKIGNLL